MIVTKRQLSLSHGTEGPKHDPYSYAEMTMEINNCKVVGHFGLLEKTELFEGEKRILVIEGDGAIEMFAGVTKLTPDEFEALYYKINGPKRRCPNCGGTKFSWSAGFVGESMQNCDNCKRTIWCEAVTESMIM